MGKSTLFNLLLGFITPDKGAIRIDGRPLADVPRQEWHRKVGYVQQEVFAVSYTHLTVPEDDNNNAHVCVIYLPLLWHLYT